MSAAPTPVSRARVIALVVVGVVLLGAATAYVAVARSNRQQQRAATSQHAASPASLSAVPRIVFRNTALNADYGRVAMVPLSDPGGARAFTGAQCDRVFVASNRTLCLATTGVITGATATTWEGADGAKQNLPLTGVPSRARLSADGRLAATTSFVAGDSYAATSFSTRTVVSRLDSGATLDLESFRLIHRGRAITPSDRNYWGVTFAADDDSFFVTVQFGGKTWLAEGSLSRRTVRTLHTDAECPSLSPDGKTVAYKKRGNRRAGDWRLAVMDLASRKETQLTEQHSVDDQVEWLDNATILYGLPDEGKNVATTNVWALPTDGHGQPRLLIRNAWSPAVVR